MKHHVNTKDVREGRCKQTKSIIQLMVINIELYPIRADR
jgi:hypothetical protein